MDRNDGSSLVLLQGNIKLLALLLAKFEEREARMGAAMDRHVRALQQEVSQAERKLDGIAVATAARIAEDARRSVAASLRDVDQAAVATAQKVRGASRTVWTWYAGLAGLAVVLCVVAWSVLGYYRRELTEAKSTLARYENAIPVVKAFHASDAAICGERLCVNVDPKAARQGARRQYRVARARPEAASDP